MGENKKSMPQEIAVLKNQQCPICKKNTLTLTESEKEIQSFGKISIFSMDCAECKYHKSDIEIPESKGPCKYVFEIKNKEDLNAKVIKSAECIIKIPYVGELSQGCASQGFITNVEGIIKRIKKQIEQTKELEEDEESKKKAKNILKKIHKVLLGDEPIKIILEDPTGNSAIISEKANAQQ